MTEENKQEKVKNKILYIGGDINFFENIQEILKKLYSSIDVEFVKLESEDDKIIQSYILKARELKPKIILVDFSLNERAKLHFARVWERQNFYTKIELIGLVDYKQGSSSVIKAIMTTMSCVHIKSLEYEAVVYDIVNLAFPDLVANHGFATAELNDPIHAYHPCKVSLINENFIKLESNYLMKPKQVLRLKNYWSRQNILRSTLMMCVDQKQDNLYYNYNYSQVLQMAHADPVEQTDSLTKEEFDDKVIKRQEIVEESRYKLKRWLTENYYNSKPKFLKAYVVDKNGVFFDHKPLTDIYPFVYRNQPFIVNAKAELIINRPHLILYNIENVDKETLEANADIAHTFNDSRMFQHLIKTAKEVCGNQQPIIVCFNSGEYDSAYMQKVFNYPNILAVKEEMTVDLAMKMAEMLKEKISPSLPTPQKGDIYIDKNADLSYAEIESDITLLGISENDIYFNSQDPLEIGSTIRVSLPVPMYATVVQTPEWTNISSQYYAIIHGIGEEEKKGLRRFINSIFFRSLDLEKANSAAEVEKIKQDYLKKQQEDLENKRKLEEAKKNEEELRKQQQQQTEDRAKEILDDLE